MKKRRNLIIALLIVATLAMTIGYAAMNASLEVNGSAGTAIDPVKLVFTGNVTKDGTEYVKNNTETVVGATAGYTTATLTVNGLKTETDYLIAEFEIQNQNTYSYTVAAPTVTYTDEHDFYTVEIHYLDPDSGNPVAVDQSFVLEGGETTKLVARVELTDDTAGVKRNGNFRITLPATSID